MSAKYFLDTNVLIYTVGNDQSKKKCAIPLLQSPAFISTQVIAESITVMHRKLKYDYPQIQSIVQMFQQHTTLCLLTNTTIQEALRLAQRYGYSYYDSQIVASALENSCAILYSEDLQDGQMIDKKLKIVNPFH